MVNSEINFWVLSTLAQVIGTLFAFYSVYYIFLTERRQRVFEERIPTMKIPRNFQIDLMEAMLIGMKRGSSRFKIYLSFTMLSIFSCIFGLLHFSIVFFIIALFLSAISIIILFVVFIKMINSDVDAMSDGLREFKKRPEVKYED